jgi:hypothetical protein
MQVVMTGSSSEARELSRRFGTHRAGAFYDRLMSLEWEQTVVDARDPRALIRRSRAASGDVGVGGCDLSSLHALSVIDV